MRNKEEKWVDLTIWIIKAAMVLTVIIMFILTFIIYPIPN